MIAKGICRGDLDRAARAIGVRIETTPLNAKGTRWRVKVNPGEAKNAEGDRRWQRISLSYDGRERRVWAVCWHGFRDFFRACFALVPDAEFRTAVEHWQGREDFEARYRDSAGRNIGSQAMPLEMANACRCEYQGEFE